MGLSYLYSIIFAIIFILKLLAVTAIEHEVPLVEVEQGLINGIKEKSLNGKEIFSYLSIPYAKPPVGHLRFKAPVHLDSWQGILDGTKTPVPCLQHTLFDFVLEDKKSIPFYGREDCLVLNVHTQKTRSEDKVPVMVFIHGGGFVGGRAEAYTPYALLNEEIVLVVIQYRLGVLGFLSTENSVLPGNMGLKDQQFALKWIKKNILKFGGDPERITLFGESAGGASVHYQLLSPNSRGLFQRAIIQSGSAFCPWSYNENHRTFAEILGRNFNCSLNSGTENYLNCMQKIDAKALVLFTTETGKWGVSPVYVMPRVDGEFILDKNEILMKEGKYNKVDIMTGVTKDEGVLVMLTLHLNSLAKGKLNSEFEEYGPYSLYFHIEENAQQLAEMVYKHYLQRENIEILEEDDEQIIKLYSDRYFLVCHDLLSKFLAEDEDINLYSYQLDYVGEVAYSDRFPGFNRRNWIGHVDDLFFLFTGPYFLQPSERDEDLRLRNIMISAWTNFAKTGNPTPPGSEFTWEKTTKENFWHLSLKPIPEMVNDSFHEVRKYWSSLKTKQNMILNPELINDSSDTKEFESKEEL